MYFGKRLTDDSRFEMPAKLLTTHGVCVGMTGSGKTGLCITIIEELRRAGVPSIIIDPKGDMTNLALAFPKLQGSDFAPWIDTTTSSEPRDAEATAQQWREGLTRDGLSGEDISAMERECPVKVFTPGSTAGAPLNILAGLAKPDIDDEETKNGMLKAAVSGLLGLVGVDADPLTGKEFILLANIVDYCWENDEETSLERIIAYVQSPPIKRIGVFTVDAFIGAGQRRELALRLNGLMASPSFRLWLIGAPLAIESLLFTADGKPQTAVLYLAHLPERERLFVIGLVAARLTVWMRRQAGTENLRALFYVDEVAGMMPPHPHNPPTKEPLLTLFKQARAFGVGVLVATQNPMDVDYKAFGNAGLWLVGRLTTANDRRRIVDGLRGVTGVPDDLAAQLAGLGKRQFFVRDVRGETSTIRSRFAMSFLRGPMTKSDIERLPQAGTIAEELPSAEAPTGLPTPPQVANVPAYFLAAEALREPELTPVFGVSAPAGRATPFYRPAFYVSCQVRYDDAKAKLAYDETVSRLAYPLDDRDQLPPFDATGTLPNLQPFLLQHPEPNARFAPLPAFLDETRELDAAAAALVGFIRHERILELLFNPELRMFSRPDEKPDDFGARCQDAADEKAKDKLAKEQTRHERTLERLDRKRSRIEARLADATAETKEREMEGVATMLETAAGFLFGRRRSVGRAVSGTLSRRRMTAKTERRKDRYVGELGELVEEIDKLQDDLADAEDAITEEFEAKARAVEVYRVEAEAGDIRVVERAVIWVPTW
jgi:Helicase HerA, central domain